MVQFSRERNPSVPNNPTLEQIEMEGGTIPRVGSNLKQCGNLAFANSLSTTPVRGNQAMMKTSDRCFKNRKESEQHSDGKGNEQPNNMQ